MRQTLSAPKLSALLKFGCATGLALSGIGLAPAQAAPGGAGRDAIAAPLIRVQAFPPADPNAGPIPPPATKPPAAPSPDAPKKEATPKTAPKAPTAPGAAAKKPAEKPGLAVAQPRSAAERDQALANLYAHLATAADEAQAKTITASIEALWATPGSDTISYLMQRAHGAGRANNHDLALQIYDAIVGLAPDYAEAWSQRAGAHYQKKQYDLAMGDVRRTLALDPNHFRALDGLLHILHDTGRKKEALKVGRQLLEVNPFHEGAKQLVDELAREIEGRGI
jgi:tetratricopeptide (TPR) repeat protein